MERKKELFAIDIVWLLYFIIIYTFNCAFNNFQMMSTILLFAISIILLCYQKGIISFIRFRHDDCVVWYGLFFLFTSLSYFWSTSEGIKSMNVFTALIQIWVFFFCFDLYTTSEREVDLISKIFCIASFFFGVVVFITSPPSTYNSLSFGRFTGMHRNTTGYIMLFACIFDIYLGKKLKQKRYFGAAGFCFVVSLLTGSRKIIFGYIIALFLWIYFQRDIKKAIDYCILIVLGAIIVIPLLYQIPYIRDAFGSRLLAVFDDSIYDGSVLARERAKELARVLFMEKPIYGNGWSSVASQYAEYWGRKSGIYAHNNYLEVGADFGIIGLILLYWKYFKDLFWCIKRARKSDEYRFLVICLIVILVLDYGQVTYCYLYMMSIYAILFKRIRLQKETELSEQIGRE